MRKPAAAALCAVLLLGACKQGEGMIDGVKSAGSVAAKGLGSVTTSLVKVDLSNVLNDLALDLKIDKSNIPINAQIPISVAANVCGISINILSIGGSGSSQGCTAQTASPELVQAVQQQLAAQGSVGGGAQTNTPAPGATPTPAPTASPSAAATPSPIPAPTPTATPQASVNPTAAPVAGATPQPTATPQPQR